MKLERWKYITAQREIYNFAILQVSVAEQQFFLASDSKCGQEQKMVVRKIPQLGIEWDVLWLLLLTKNTMRIIV